MTATPDFTPEQRAAVEAIERELTERGNANLIGGNSYVGDVTTLAVANELRARLLAVAESLGFDSSHLLEVKARPSRGERGEHTIKVGWLVTPELAQAIADADMPPWS